MATAEPQPQPQPPAPAPRQGAAAPTPGDAGAGEADAAVYEETHVHGVYEAIAPHFSATRHRPWPFVSAFLASQPPGSVGLDVGCGNGKNMGANRDVVMLGCDRSAALAALARDMWCTRRVRPEAEGDHPVVVVPGADAMVADGLGLPFRDARADFVICIAVVHHLSTRERRVDAIRQLLRCVRRKEKASPSSSSSETGSGGKVLVYVWALEQSTSRRGWDEGGEQDLLVPWVMKAPQQKKPKAPKPPRQKKEKKQKHDSPTAAAAAAAAVASTVQGDATRNGNSEIHDPSGGEGMQGQRQESHGNRHEAGACGSGGGAEEASQQQQQQMAAAVIAAAAAAGAAVPGGHEEKASGDGGADADGKQGDGQRHTDKTFHRFYHLYRKGELEEDVVAAGGEVLRSGYERDNWWVIAG